MLNWNLLLDEAALASVLPDDYAHFRRPIAGALSLFLEQLPAAYQAAVVAEQNALPPTASVSQRWATLARSCPSLHKLGQILARERRLSAELRQHLQQLESLPPSVPLDTVQTALRQELGPLRQYGLTLLPPALAEGSVAVVIPFRADHGPHRQGVFKVLKPGIEERLEQELVLFERVGAYLDLRCDEFRIPHLDYQEVFEQVRELLRHEYRLDLEQRHLEQARVFYEGEPRVQIPALLDPCTPRVTAMERILGGKVTESRLCPEAEKRRLAKLLVEALIARPVFRRTGQALFHGDPHAGNLFLTPDGRLAILDWSLVGSLGERERTVMVQMILAGLTLDSAQLSALLEGLAERNQVDRPSLDTVVHSGLGRIRRGAFPGFTWLMDLLNEAVQAAGLRVAADLLLFRKALYTLEGVAADVAAGEARFGAVLLGEFIGHLLKEWPERWWTMPNSRAFATRLSNADLLQLLLSMPSTVARFWRDALRSATTGR